MVHEKTIEKGTATQERNVIRGILEHMDMKQVWRAEAYMMMG